MKNKGFTLIELLAVIVILAVIALIATPLIMGTITKAKRNAIKDTAYGILKAGEQYVGEKLVESDNDYNGETIILPNQDKLQYKGGNGITGKLKISKQGDLALQIHNNQFCVLKNFDDNEITLTNYDIDSCKLVEPTPFEKDSWEMISQTVQENPTFYPVGSEKEITLTGEYTGTYTLRVANNTTPDECKQEGFSQTACGFVIEFKDIITNEKINSSNTNQGGWPAMPLHTILNKNIYNSLPESLKNVIKNTKVISSHGSDDSSNFQSTDKLYLLATKEVWGKDGSKNPINYDTSDTNTRQLDYYKNKGVTTSNYSVAVKQYNSLNEDWWLRSANSNSKTHFFRVTSPGEWSSHYPYDANGIAPAFRL